jgi:hypothetical protein
MKRYLQSTLLALLVAAIGITWAARDGSGTYVLPAGNPVSTGTTISSTWANSTLSDIATALTNSLSKDGQTVPTANLPMGGFKHTNVADATSRNQYASAGQVQDGSTKTLTSVSGTNTIIGSLNPPLTSYATEMVVSFTPTGNNTGAATLSINGLSARPIVKFDGDALVSGDLVSGIPALLVASGSQFILLNPQTADVTAATILSRLLTVDGAGSGLDADLLDGQDSAFYRNAGNLNAGSVPSAQIAQASVTQHQGALSIAASQVTSGTLADARVAQSSVTQHQGALTTRNISGKGGTTKTLSTSAASGGTDGDIWYRY